MSTAQVIPFQEIEARATDWHAQASALVVSNQGELELVSGFLQGIKALRAEIADTFDEPTRKAFDAHKALVAARKKLEQPLIEAESIAKRKAGDYIAETERQQRAAAALAEAAAREDREKADATARELEKAGEHELAEAIREEAGIAAAPPIAAPAPRAAGIAARSVWKYRVTDLRALVAAVQRDELPLSLLEVNATALGQLVRALKGSKAIPGVESWEEKGIATR